MRRATARQKKVTRPCRPSICCNAGQPAPRSQWLATALTLLTSSAECIKSSSVCATDTSLRPLRLANLCSDQIETYSVQALDQLLVLLNQRGVGRVFLAQMAQRLQDRRTTAVASEQAHYPDDYRDWLHSALPDLAAMQT